MRCTLKYLVITLVALCLCLGTGLQAGAHEGPTRTDGLGDVHFSVSCAGEAQAKFHRAMALYHSFDWKRGKAAFDEIASLDPRCGMAHWGLAMIAADNPFGWPVSLKLQGGRRGDPARRRTLGLPRRASATTSRRSRCSTRTMRRCRTVNAPSPMSRRWRSSRPPIPTTSKRRSSTALASERQPRPQRQDLCAAAQGGGSARAPVRRLSPASRCGALPDPQLRLSAHRAQGAGGGEALRPDRARCVARPPHALAHLHPRGLPGASRWPRTRRASPPPKAIRATFRTGGTTWSTPTCRWPTMPRPTRSGPRPGPWRAEQVQLRRVFGVAAIPARLALERGRWAEAATLPLHPIVSADGWKRFPQAESINAFARALGAARSGDAAGARQEIERLHSPAHRCSPNGSSPTGPSRPRSRRRSPPPGPCAPKASTRRRSPPCARPPTMRIRPRSTL